MLQLNFQSRFAEARNKVAADGIGVKFEPQEIRIAIDEEQILFDFSQFELYWQLLKKNIDRVVVGPHAVEPKRFSTCPVSSNLFDIYLSLLLTALTELTTETPTSVCPK